MSKHDLTNVDFLATAGETRDAAEWGYPLISYQVSRDKLALVVVDMQEGYLRRGSVTDRKLVGSRREAEYYFERVEQVCLPNCALLVDAFRRQRLPVFFVAYGSYRDDWSDLPEKARRRSRMLEERFGVKSPPIVDTPEFAIAAELCFSEGDNLIVKHSMSAFNSTNLEWRLRHGGVSQLVLCGVGTNGCVEGTGRDGNDLGFECAFVHDATATFEPETQAHTVRNFARFLGTVTSTERVLQGLDADVTR